MCELSQREPPPKGIAFYFIFFQTYFAVSISSSLLCLFLTNVILVSTTAAAATATNAVVWLLQEGFLLLKGVQLSTVVERGVSRVLAEREVCVGEKGCGGGWVG